MIIDDQEENVSYNDEIITPYNENDYVIPAQSPVERNKKIIYHEVRIGETIEEIAEHYKQAINEIAILNDLYPPYYLEEFQVLKIRVARNHKTTKIILTEPSGSIVLSSLGSPSFAERIYLPSGENVTISGK